MFSLYSGIIGDIHGFSLCSNGPTTLLGTFALFDIDLNIVPVLCNAPWGHSCSRSTLGTVLGAAPPSVAPPSAEVSRVRVGVVQHLVLEPGTPHPTPPLSHFVFLLHRVKKPLGAIP